MSEAASLVATLRDRIDGFEAEWRRRYMPPPTRERPRPDPAALDGARRLETAARELDGIASQLRARATTTTFQAEADAALRQHVTFLLDLLGPVPDVTTLPPEQLEREIAALRELARRRSATPDTPVNGGNTVR